MPAHDNVQNYTVPAGKPTDYKAPKPRVRRTKKAASPVIAPVQNNESKYAPTAWGSAPGDMLEDLRVPSGQLCQVRRPGVEGLVKAGVLHDMDSLTAIVDNKHIKRAKGQKAIDVNALAQDTETITNVLHVTDRIVCHIVVQPTIEMTPNDPTNRKPGVIYADMIDLDDKMFLLNYAVGGTRDLERFRGEFDNAMGSMDNSKNVGRSSK